MLEDSKIIKYQKLYLKKPLQKIGCFLLNAVSFFSSIFSTTEFLFFPNIFSQFGFLVPDDVLYCGELWTWSWEWVYPWVRGWLGVCGVISGRIWAGKFILASLFIIFLFEHGVWGNNLFSSLLTEIELRTLDDFWRDKLFSLDLDCEFYLAKLLFFSYPS